MMTKTQKILLDLGLDDTLAGFRILETAVKLVVEQPAYERHIVSECFVDACEAAGLAENPSAAGRNVSYALKRAQRERDMVARLDKVESRWGITGLSRDVLLPNGSVSSKKLILKLAHALGETNDREV